jgi:hypothetical protein
MNILKHYPALSVFTKTKNMKQLVLFCSISFLTSVASAQIDSAQKVSSRPYIANFGRIMTTKASLIYNEERFLVSGPGFNYDIRPNAPISLSFYMNYRFISMGYGYGLNNVLGDEYSTRLRGKTKVHRFYLNFQTNHLIQDIQFSSTRGYFLYNTPEYRTNWERGRDPYILFPDQKVVRISGATGYKFNKRFSLKSITTQAERQLRSCGSFIVYLNYGYYLIDNSLRNGYSNSSEKTNLYYGNLSVAYYYNFVLLSKLYLSLGLAPSFGYSYKSVTQRNGNYIYNWNDWDPNVGLMEHVGLGWNTDRFFMGAEAYIGQNLVDQESGVQMDIVNSRFQAFLGVRLGLPKPAKKLLGSVEKVLQKKLVDLLEEDTE